MEPKPESKLTKFFTEFTEFSERARHHWPLANDSKSKKPDFGIGYVFTAFSPLLSESPNEQLLDSFLTDIYSDTRNLLSGRQTIPGEQIKLQLQDKRIGKTDHSALFLVVGHPTHNTQARVGCIGHFFAPSKTIIIESIWMEYDTDALEQGVKELQQIEVDLAEDRKNTIIQTILKWLLTYKVVGKDGKRAGLKVLMDQIGDPIEGVFHEVHNPSLLEGDRVKNGVDKLKHFRSIGARYLNFAYRRPEIIADGSYSENLLLLTFPEYLKTDGGLRIKATSVMKFIIDYGQCLNQSYANYQNDFTQAADFCRNAKNILGISKNLPNDPIHQNSLALLGSLVGKEHIGKLYLHCVPRAEEPRFIFRRSSIGFEIVVDEDYFKPTGLSDEHDTFHQEPERTRFGKLWKIISDEWTENRDGRGDALYCEVAHSGETDLFAYKYQSDPPYFTKYFGSAEVNVTFPSYFEFTSEGRAEIFYKLPSDDNRSVIANSMEPFPKFPYTVKMMACVSYTYFRNSAVRVWHLVLKAGEDPISELEIIKLTRFFSGSQEHESEEARRRVMEQISFTLIEDAHNGASDTSTAQSTEAKSASTLKKVWTSLSFLFFGSKFRANVIHTKAITKNIQWIVWFVKTWGLGTAVIVTSFIWYRLYLGKKIFIREPSTLLSSSLSVIYIVIALLLTIGILSWAISITKRLSYALQSVIKKVFDRWIYKKESFEEKNPEKQLNLIDLLACLTGVRYEKRDNTQSEKQLPQDQIVSLRNVTSGVVEIDTGTLLPDDLAEKFDQQNFLGFYANPATIKPDSETQNKIRRKIIEMYKDLYDGDISNDDNQDAVVEEYADYIFKSYCGICLGIFDYDRMGFQEIDDTLVPLPDSKTEKSFLSIHRGVLAMIGSEDNVLDTFWNTLGINAYLIIPSAVLAQNDKVARDAEGRLDRLLSSLRSGYSTLSIRELNKERNEIDDLLNDDILGNVFQYKTEKELYQRGMELRGIQERISDSRSKLEQLEKLIQLKQDESTSRYQKRITYLATIVGIFSFYSVVKDYFVDELAVKYINAAKLIKKPDKYEQFVLREDLPYWFRIPVEFVDELLPLKILPNERMYEPLGLAHIAIGFIFATLFGYILISIISDPDRNRKFFWKRNKKRSQHIPNTHASSTKNHPFSDQ